MQRLLLMGAAALVLTGCASSAQPGGTVSVPPSAAVVAVDENANHSTVQAHVGATVKVELHSTYWSSVSSSSTQLLEPSGATSAPSPSCRPGGGCGTVTGSFVARKAGSVQLVADRTSCGEAKPCAPDQQHFTVTVQITG